MKQDKSPSKIAWAKRVKKRKRDIPRKTRLKGIAEIGVRRGNRYKKSKT